MNVFDIDKNLFFFINSGTVNALFDVVMPFLTAKGYLLILPYATYMLIKAYKLKKAGQDEHIKIALTAIGISILSFLLSDWLAGEFKHLIGRIRPCNGLEGVRLLVGCSKSGSMPSNHATNSFAYAIPLFFLTRGYLKLWWRLYPLALAALVAFSRVYVGVHYPSDVIVGALFGTVIAFSVIWLYKYLALHYKTRPHTTLLFGFLLVIGVFRVYYILHGPLDLSPDEAHYWEWSRRLDLSYYSKGPMIAYLIYIGTAIFGDNVFGIRIMAVIFSALSSIYLFKLVAYMYNKEGSRGKNQKLKNELIALTSAILLQIIPMFAPFGVIFTIDSPFIFFWILSMYIFWRAITSEDSPSTSSGDSVELQKTEDRVKTQSFAHQTPNSKLTNWLILGISIGLGLLTKYTMVFFYLCTFLFLLFSEKKFLLKTVKPYLALIISLGIFSPVIIWNMQHDWVTVRHTAGQAHVYEGIKISLKTFFEFLGSQVGIITPIIFGMMSYAMFKLSAGSKHQEPAELLKSKFLLFFSMPVIGFFLLKSIHAKVQPNWAMTGYITGIIALSKYFKGQGSRVRAQGNLLLVMGIGLALFVTVIGHYPSIIKLPPKLDPSSRLRGWKELGTEVSRIYDSIAEKGQVFIFSDRYQVSSELAFYVKGNPRTYCINLGRRMNQYDLWPDMNEEFRVKNKINIQDRGVPKKSKTFWGGIGPRTQDSKLIYGIFVRIDNTDIPLDVAMAFDSCEKKLLRVYDKEYLLREYSIFICYNFKGVKTVRPKTY